MTPMYTLPQIIRDPFSFCSLIFQILLLVLLIFLFSIFIVFLKIKIETPI